jgi:hypothetical protein
VSHRRGALHAAQLVKYNDLQAAFPIGTDSRLDSVPRRSGRFNLTSARTSNNKPKNKRGTVFVRVNKSNARRHDPAGRSSGVSIS